MTSGAEGLDGNDPLAARLDEVRASWGIDFSSARAVLAALAGGPAVSVSRLVEIGKVPRRRVLGILRAVEAWADQGEGAVRLRPEAAARVAAWLGPAHADRDTDGDHWDGLARRRADLVARLEEFAAGLPPSRWNLDHVPATAHTMAKRAVYLTHTYALAGAHLLCVGDHDLTSLAVALIEPTATVTVVDIDERILAHIDGLARREDLAIVTARADLRLGLPPSLAGRADLAFTDPPYTPDGVRLFLRRGLEGLNRDRPSRVVFCYGFGDRNSARALEIQAVVGDLRLALDAVHPQFNAYAGAESIGGRSHLYVCRPTRTTWAALRSAGRPQALIYSRGSAAENGAAGELPVAAATTVAEIVAAHGPGVGNGPRLVVGDGWPDGIGPGGEVGGAHRMTLDGYLAGHRPAKGIAVVNLHPHFGSALVDVVLGAPEVAIVVVSGRSWRTGGLAAPADPVRRLFEAAFTFEVLARRGEDDPVVVAVRRRRDAPADPVTRLYRYLIGHDGAKVVNAWREGLVDVGESAGVSLTKNRARAAVAATGPGPSLEDLRLGELPLGSLRQLAEAARLSVNAILTEVASD